MLQYLPFDSGETMAQRLGRRGLKAHGEEEWRKSVATAVRELRQALAVDYVTLGGGNSKLVDPPIEGVRLGGNEDAFAGGFRLWEEEVLPHDVHPGAAWRVVR